MVIVIDGERTKTMSRVAESDHLERQGVVTVLRALAHSGSTPVDVFHAYRLKFVSVGIKPVAILCRMHKLMQKRRRGVTQDGLGRITIASEFDRGQQRRVPRDRPYERWLVQRTIE